MPARSDGAREDHPKNVGARIAVDENHLRTERMGVMTGMIAIERMRTEWSTITARSVVKIADARGIVSGVVNGTARKSAFCVTARAITIGAVAPIADTATISLLLFTRDSDSDEKHRSHRRSRKSH